MEMLEAALAYVRAGLSVIPIKAVDKKPCLATWDEFKKVRRATEDEVRAWFSVPGRKIGLIGGAVSGNVEMLDFDEKGAAAKPWKELVQGRAPGLFERLVVEQTPSGGYHCCYRCEAPVDGSTKIAKRAVKIAPEDIYLNGKGHEAAKINGKEHVLNNEGLAILCPIETRGEGGYCVVYPSEGYEMRHGSFSAMPTITKAERDILISCAHALNEYVSPIDIKNGSKTLATKNKPGEPLRPGDDFNLRGDIVPILLRHGWAREPSNTGDYWTRPGKSEGISGSLLEGKVFYVFTSNGNPFDMNKGYSRFSVYGLLEHNGDFDAAARTLAKDGYGTSLSGTPPAPSTIHATFVNEPLPDRPGQELPAAPTDDELREIYRGTAFGVFVDEVFKTEPQIKPILAITGALVMQSALLTRCICVRGKKPNCYAGLVATGSSGKGTVARAVQKFLLTLRMDMIDVSSQKTVLKSGAGPNPWGVMVVGEFEPFIKQNTWQNDSIPILNDLFDGFCVSSSSEKSGKTCIMNAAPSVLGCIHPQRFIDSGMSLLKSNGFLSRMLLAWDDTVLPDLVTLTKSGALEDVNMDATMAAFQMDYSWLPPPMPPSRESTDKKGHWEHPVAPHNIEVEAFESLWHKCKFASALRSEMTRWVKNYLPLLSIPFETHDNLNRRILTAESLARGERVLLSYYWALANAVREIPETEGEFLIKKLVSYVQRHPPEVSRRTLSQGVAHNSQKEFETALVVIEDRGLLRVRTVVNKNKTISQHFSSFESAPVVLAPFRALPPRPSISQNEPPKFPTLAPTLPEILEPVALEWQDNGGLDI